MPQLVLLGPSWPFRGGIARTTTALAGALERRAALAALLVPRRQYPRWIYPGGGDVDTDACARLPFAEDLYAVLEPWTWPAALRRLRGVAADAVVLPYWTWAWAPFALCVTGRVRVPLITIVHNPADHDASAPARWGAHAVLGRSRAFLCHAGAVADELRSRYGQRPTTVHPLPVEPRPRVDRAEARRALGVASDSVSFLYFGIVRPYKGVDTLLDAFAALPLGARAVLLLAGEPWGGEGERLAERLADPRLSGRVIARLEWVPEVEAPKWFAAADVAVLPYRTATGSAVAAQAMGAGLPVVGSAVGGLAEVVVDGTSGLLVPPGDVGALTAALAAMLDEELRRRLAAGSEASGRRWTWDSYAAALLELAAAVLGGQGRRGHEPGEGR